jgi:hypothetical protein
MLRAAFAGGHARDYLSSISAHLTSMKRAFLARYALHDDARVSINEYAQAFLPRIIFFLKERAM